MEKNDNMQNLLELLNNDIMQANIWEHKLHNHEGSQPF